MRSNAGVTAHFHRTGGRWNWTACEDKVARRVWKIAGPRLSLQTPDGQRTNLGDIGFAHLSAYERDGGSQVALSTRLKTPPVAVRQVFRFCPDGRTLRIKTSIRALEEPLTIQRVGLLEIQVEGETLQLFGPTLVSLPVFGESIFAGIEHPSAWRQVSGDTLYLAQHSYVQLDRHWIDLPTAVLGFASVEDLACAAQTHPGDAASAYWAAVRRAFLRYLDTVRIKPRDLHVHYNDWWTAPVPSSEAFVLNNIAELKRGLYDLTGFFFDSYAMDMGWSDPHTVWAINKQQFPSGFGKVRDALAEMNSRPGLWVSPSSVYPPALDNAWLQAQGYEVISETSDKPRAACIALGGRYQTAFKKAVLTHARNARLAHVKFDGFVPACNAQNHGHPAAEESYLPLANGLADVFDALRRQNPAIALEPTCFGYYPSPWWLMHVPFLIGPFGDDSPHGRCPCPEWVESMTTGREIAVLQGRDAFLMPSNALQCFDIIVQCPGDFQNHAVMAIGRGRWFISCYINPKFMSAEEWQFFADLIAWARHNRKFLQDPVPFGGNPAKREAYGYSFIHPERSLFCLRNPWIEETTIALPISTPPEQTPMPQADIRMLYPRRALLTRTDKNAPPPHIRLGPYETVFVEAVPSGNRVEEEFISKEPVVTWQPSSRPVVRRLLFQDDPPAFGPSWTCPEGDVKQLLQLRVEGNLSIDGASDSELCILSEGPPDVNLSRCTLTIDGTECLLKTSGTHGAFAATGASQEEHWLWFTTPLPKRAQHVSGPHRIVVEIATPTSAATYSVFVRGSMPAPPSTPSFDPEPAFPVYRPERVPWSRVLILQTPAPEAVVPTQTVPRPIVRIDGLYLDTLDWKEASAGWGKVCRNRSVMNNRMMIGGAIFHRGIGTHAASRIVYVLPKGYASFAATIGYDQEVRGGSVVFAVLADGRELFRSPVLRYDDAPLPIHVPLGGAETLTLIVEDAGDGITADHANWADARLMK